MTITDGSFRCCNLIFFCLLLLMRVFEKVVNVKSPQRSVTKPRSNLSLPLHGDFLLSRAAETLKSPHVGIGLWWCLLWMHTATPLHLNKRGHFHDKGQLLTFIGSACSDITKGCVAVSVCACLRGGTGAAAEDKKKKRGGPDERGRVGKSQPVKQRWETEVDSVNRWKERLSFLTVSVYVVTRTSVVLRKIRS